MDIKVSLCSQPSNLQQPQTHHTWSPINNCKGKVSERERKQYQTNMIESFDTSSNNDSFLQIEKQIQEEKPNKHVNLGNQSELKISDTSVIEFDQLNLKKLSLENQKEYPLSTTSKTNQDYKIGLSLKGAIQQFSNVYSGKAPYNMENTEIKKKVRGNITTEKSSPIKMNEFIYIENDSDSQGKYQELRQQHQKLLYRKSDSIQLTNFNPSHYSVHSQSSNHHPVRYDPNFGQSILETLNNIDNSKNLYNKSDIASQRDEFDFNQYTKSSRVSINQDISASDFRTRRNFSTNRSKVRLSQNFLKEGRVEEALIQVNEYISEQNQHEYDQAQAFYVRGQIFERMGYFPQAIQNYKTALQINPQLINAALAKASCESRNGQLEDAIDSYAQALALEKEGAFPSQNNNIIELRNENQKLDQSKSSIGKKQAQELPLTSRNSRKEVEPTISKFGKIEINLDIVKKSATVTGVHSRKSSNVSDLNVIKDKKVNFKIEDEKIEIKNSKVTKGKKIKKPKQEQTKQVTSLTNQKAVLVKKKSNEKGNKSPLTNTMKAKVQSPKLKKKENSDLLVQTVPSVSIFPDFSKRQSETFVYKKKLLEQQTVQVKGRNEKISVVNTDGGLSKNAINLQSMKTIQTVTLQDSPMIKKKKSQRGRQDSVMNRSEASSSRQSSNFNSKVIGQRSLYKRPDRSNSNSLLRKGKPVTPTINKKVQKVSSMNFKGQLIKIEQLMKDGQLTKAQETVDQLQEVVYNCKETLSKQNLEQYFRFQVMLKIKKGFPSEALVIINKYLDDCSDKKLLTAKCLIKMDNYKLALDEIQRMLVESETFGLYYLKGKVLMLNKEWKAALISFNNSSILDEETPQVNVMKAICYLKMKQENRFNVEIEEIKDKIRDIKPHHLLKLLRAIKENSSSFECCQFYLYSLILKIPISEGEQSCQKEVKLMEFIAKVYLEQNNYAKAITCLKGLGKKQEKHYQMMAKCYYKQQNFVETLNSLNNIKEQSIKISYFKLKVLYHCEKYKDAVAQVQYVLTKNKKEEEEQEKLSLRQEAKATLYWGLCLSAVKRFGLAVTQFTKILSDEKFQIPEIEKIRTDACHQRAKALQQTEMHEQAVEDLTFLINNKEDSKYLSQWLLLRAISLQNLGQEQKAQKDYNSAKEN